MFTCTLISHAELSATVRMEATQMLITGGRDKDVVRTHTHTHVEHYSAIKKSENAICSNMNGPQIVVVSEVSQAER